MKNEYGIYFLQMVAYFRFIGILLKSAFDWTKENISTLNIQQNLPPTNEFKRNVYACLWNEMVLTL